MPPHKHPQFPRIIEKIRFEVVLFDLGSTLIHFDGRWPEVVGQMDSALVEYLRQTGLSLDGAVFIQAFRDRLESYFDERDSDYIEYTTGFILSTVLADWGYANLPEELISGAMRTMYAVSQAHWHPEADAIPTLEELRRRGYRLGLISNAGDDTDVQTLIDNAHLRPHFEAILTSAKAGIRKPSPRIFMTVLDEMRVSPERAVMVGDTLEADVLGAHNAGMSGIWITRRADTPANRAKAEAIQPDAIIATLSDLPQTLQIPETFRSFRGNHC